MASIEMAFHSPVLKNKITKTIESITDKKLNIDERFRQLEELSQETRQIDPEISRNIEVIINKMKLNSTLFT